jgi:hypothetical protein
LELLIESFGLRAGSGVWGKEQNGQKSRRCDSKIVSGVEGHELKDYHSGAERKKLLQKENPRKGPSTSPLRGFER